MLESVNTITSRYPMGCSNSPCYAVDSFTQTASSCASLGGGAYVCLASTPRWSSVTLYSSLLHGVYVHAQVSTAYHATFVATCACLYPMMVVNTLLEEEQDNVLPGSMSLGESTRRIILSRLSHSTGTSRAIKLKLGRHLHS